MTVNRGGCAVRAPASFPRGGVMRRVAGRSRCVMKAIPRVASAFVALGCAADDAMAQSGPDGNERPPSGDIVVTAPRRGEAEVPAETEFGEEEIAGYGADNIDEILGLLAPLIDASGEEPVILVNGKEIGFDRSILAYPPEALNRIAVLKAEAAGHYGHASGRRVVNLVLKKNYASRHAEAAVHGATGGGQHGGDLTAGQMAIAGETRWNVQGRVSLESALRKSARNVAAEGGPIDLVGYVVPAGGEEIDPALSKVVGAPVAVAAVPAMADGGPPELADFAEGIHSTHQASPERFETLRPSRRNLSLALAASRPLGPFDASVSVNATSNRSSRLRGVPMTSVILPAGGVWSPFARDVLLVRPLAGDRTLRSENSARSLSFSLTLSGALGSWRTMVSGSYARSWADSRLEQGIDTALVQALIDANDPAFNPYAPWPERLLKVTGSRSESESLGLRLNLARPLLDLPAGPVTANLSADASRDRSSYHGLDGSDRAPDVYTREHLGGELSLSIPVARGGADFLGTLGDLTADLFLGGQAATGSGLRRQYGGGFTWSPAALLEVLGAFKHREVVPSSEQLGAPRIETVRRVYDFVRQEVAEPLWITGGNPLLHRGSRQSLSLDVRVRPFDSPVLSLSVGYRQSSGEGGVAPFPELTPTIEAAFPERITRDSEGRLRSVDARAINVAATRSAELVSGIALRLPAPSSSQGNAEEPAADPLRLTFSLNHTWRLESEFLTRAGMPPIDQLAETGQSRHYLSLQATAGKRGIGGDLRATWSSPAQVRSSHSAGRDYRYRPPLMVNAGVFILPDKLWAGAEEVGWLENLKVSLEVENLLDTYRRVTLSDGSVPPGFSRYEVDPLGRTVELSVRKRF